MHEHAVTIREGAERYAHDAHGPFVYDHRRKRLFVEGRPVCLTNTELDLSLFFLRNVGRDISRDEIWRAVWKTPLNEMSRSLDTHVAVIRRKLQIERPGYELKSLYRFGYRLQIPERSCPI